MNLFHISIVSTLLGKTQLLCCQGPGRRMVWRTPGPRCQPLLVSVADAFALAQFLKLDMVQFNRHGAHVHDVSPVEHVAHEEAIGVDVGFVQLAEQAHFSHEELLAAAGHEDLANFWGSHSISPDVDAWITANWPNWKAYFTKCLSKAKAAAGKTFTIAELAAAGCGDAPATN